MEQIGEHTVNCSNILTANFDELMNGEMADIFYSDPPWGQGNIKWWETKHFKDTGTDRSNTTLDDMLGRVFDVATRYAKEYIFIEYGKRWSDLIKQYGVSRGLYYAGGVETLYRTGKGLLPLDIHLFTKSGINVPQAYFDSIYHLADYKAVIAAVTPFAVPGGILLDPMCGLGNSARIAVELGMRFRGNELNGIRLKKAKNKLK